MAKYYARVMLCLLSLIGFMVSVPLAAGSSLLEPVNRWLCPDEMDEPLGVIIEKMHERVLTETYFVNSSGSSIPYGTEATGREKVDARSVLAGLFILPAAFDEVRGALLKRVAENVGIQSYSDHEKWNIEEVYGYMIRAEPIGLLNRVQSHEEAISLWGEVERKANSAARFLKPIGFNFKLFRATEITTKPYNLVPSREGLSQAALLVWDGKGTPKEALSFVLVVRGDKAKEWGLMSMHAPIPGYWDTYSRYVSSTEYNLIDEVAGELATSFAVFPFGLGSKGSAPYIYWKRARHWIDAYEKAPTTVTPPKLQPCK